MQSAIQEALRVEKKPAQALKSTPEKNLMRPKIIRGSEEKKSTASNKGYSSFLGNWNKVNSKNTTQDIRKSFEKLNLNNPDLLKVPNKLPKGPSKLCSCQSPKVEQKPLFNEKTSM